MRALLIAVMLLAATPAWAQWVRYDKNNIATFYYDSASVQRDGQLRRVWEIVDLNERGTRGDMSSRVLWEYDCKGERHRILSASMHSERMAGGRTLYVDDSPIQWSDIRPGTPNETMRKIVCPAATPAGAQWVRFDATADGATHYYDPASVRRAGDLRRLWSISDWNERRRDGAMSLRTFWEFDCKGERYRFLSLSWHSERMAVGRTLQTDNSPIPWDHTTPGTVNGTLLKIVCKS
jgi:hypothetical protein